MLRPKLIEKLNADLTNEYTHMHYYLHHSVMVEGINRAEISEWLLEHAKSEFEHVQQFAKMIVGLGGVPTTEHNPFPTYKTPEAILRGAYDLESQVVTNYAHRMEEVEVSEETTFGGTDLLTKSDKKYVILFLEDQLLDSRGDLDEIAQFLKGA